MVPGNHGKVFEFLPQREDSLLCILCMTAYAHSCTLCNVHKLGFGCCCYDILWLV